MAKRTCRIMFQMNFEGEIDVDSPEEAEKRMADITTGDVWNDRDNWTLESTNRRIIDSWDHDNDTEEEDD